MGKLIFRKLSWDILQFFLISSIGITLIVWIIQAVNLLDIVSEDGHGIKVYLLYMFLSLPKIFSKLMVFIFFISTFYILNKYEENNEILVFWSNGIKKIELINFLARFSFVFLCIQLLFSLYIVPYSQNLAQVYLKNSSVDFFPKLINEKKFTNVVENLTIFVEEYKENGILEGIYIKEKVNENESKIITANKGKILNINNNFKLKLYEGGITNVDSNKAYNLNFNESEYDLSKFSSKTRKYQKLQETNSLALFYCFKKFIMERKNENLNCNNEILFPLKEIYEELFKRIIFPIYIIILALISSSLLVKPRSNLSFGNYKFLIFVIGFVLIIFSQLSFKFVFNSIYIEVLTILFPILSIFIFYLSIFIKTKFRINYL